MGRRGGPQISFVVRDDAAGAIVLPQGRFTAVGFPGPDGAPVSGVASGSLHLRWQFDYQDGTVPEPATIRELGVFLGTEIKPAVLAAAPGKSYFAPFELQDAGTLLSLKRIPKFLRSDETRQDFAFVIVL